MNVNGLTFTKHARERYAERIIGKENARDINVFVTEHGEKIEKDIIKMIETGEELFTGKPSFNNPKQHNCTYIINGFWIIVVDALDNKVVTLYEIDLGAGDDIDKAFSDRMLDKIHVAKEVVESTKAEIDNEIKTYKTIISDNMDIISELRKQIKNLESVNDGYQGTIDAVTKRKTMAEDTVKRHVVTLVGRKTF